MTSVCQDASSLVGKVLLFLGIEAAQWSTSQFEEAATFANAHGIDTLVVKVADGGDLWYGGVDGYSAIRAAIQAHGCGVLPYTYMYGDKFGFFDGEIDILIEYLDAFPDHCVCADMEVEWNGQVDWAQHMNDRMLPVPGTLYVSTWADPDQQSWQDVARALAPCVNAWMPQQYDNWLASVSGAQFAALGITCLQPTFALTQAVGPNDVVQLVQNAQNAGNLTISLWEYQAATQDPGLVDQIVQVYKG